MRVFFLALFVAVSAPLFAQDDLFSMLDAAQGPVKNAPVAATFKGTRVVNLQTNELPASGVGQLIISHRFGTINDRPLYNFLGLDVAQMRLEYSYSPAHWLNLGLGRSSGNKTYDAFAKVRFLRQKQDGMPLSAVYYHSTNLNSTDFNDGVNHYFTDRMAFTHQLILARKWSDEFSFEVAPTVVLEPIETMLELKYVRLVGIASVRMSVGNVTFGSRKVTRYVTCSPIVS